MFNRKTLTFCNDVAFINGVKIRDKQEKCNKIPHLTTNDTIELCDSYYLFLGWSFIWKMASIGGLSEVLIGRLLISPHYFKEPDVLLWSGILVCVECTFVIKGNKI